jgi:dienelactone hydrolase
MRLAPLLLALALALALAGCAGGPPRPTLPEPGVAVSTAEVQGWHLVLTRGPHAAARQPLVVYLPGLGQPAEAGQRWQAAWAGAGYTVLSVQLLAADAQAWRSELARTGEFGALGRLHYGPGLRAERQQALRRLVAVLQADPAWAALDWQHAALAGYETGAQTALDWRADAGAPWRPRAVIAISPLLLEPPEPLAAAQPGSTPLLLVSSDNDLDPLGLAARPADRHRVWDAQPAGTAWWLNLASVTHAGLAGTLPHEAWLTQDLRPADRAPSRPGGPAGAAMSAGWGLRSGSATEAALANLQEAWRLSLALLDAELRGDAAARARLDEQRR